MQLALRRIINFALGLLLLPVTGYGYLDGIVTNREGGRQYIDFVEKELGWEAISDFRPDYLMYVAQRLGQIDRLHMDPEDFVDHLKATMAVESRYFPDLDPGLVKRYLLPFRIGYEYTSRPTWKIELQEFFNSIVDDSHAASEAGEKILSWIDVNLECTTSAESYLIATRGWMDPLSTKRGKRGKEEEIALLAVAAFRSIGIPARLVYTHAISGGAGGKVWMEYFGDDRDWRTWVPSFGGSKDHRQEIRDRYEGKVALVLTNPEEPISITGTYFKTGRVIFKTSDPSVSFQPLFMVLTNKGLVSVMGNAASLSPFQVGANELGVSELISAAGANGLCLENRAITVSEVPVWCLVDIAEKRQHVEVSTNAPSEFRVKGRRRSR